MTKELINKAFAEAEKERQEKEIGKIKKIIQCYLEKIQSKSDERKKLDEEIKLLKSDLDDMKSGRLDKICERQEKDEKAREIAIVRIKKVEKEYIPYQPWKSPWIIEWKSTQLPQYTPYTTCLNTSSNLTLTAVGTDFTTFSSGSYQVGNKVINF